jgi:hypothetical protein
MVDKIIELKTLNAAYIAAKGSLDVLFRFLFPCAPTSKNRTLFINQI